MTENKRGGAGRGQGRKPIKEGQDTVTVSLRMTEAQRNKLALLGGAEWVRQRIDKAKAPNGEVRGASRLAGEASSAEGATSTVVLGNGGNDGQ